MNKSIILKIFKLEYLLVFLLLCLSVELTFLTAFKQKQITILTKQLHDLKLSYQDEEEFNLFNWLGPITPEYLDMTPSLLPIIQTDKPVSLSCLNMPVQQSLKDIQNSIKTLSLLENGLKYIENYEYTINLQDDKGNILPPIISRHDIIYNKICRLSDDTTLSNKSYIVLFLTQTENKNKPLSLTPKVFSAGGWLGNSHLALITESSVKIYENFPVKAELITLPKQGKYPVLSRFGAYYNCNDIILATNKHIIIACSGNQYAFNRLDETFKEIGICGPVVQNGSYMTSKTACYDNNGDRYYYTDDSVNQN